MLIEVLPYNPEWAQEYDTEKQALHESLGERVTRIHHIGSTAVSGLAAKPIIDILLEVPSLSRLDAATDDFLQLGYEVMGAFGIPGRRYYRNGGTHRTHHIHAFAVGDDHIQRHLAFRDYLRMHPEVRLAYAALKMRLASECNHDNECYCDGKDSFVKHHEAQALEWIANGERQ